MLILNESKNVVFRVSGNILYLAGDFLCNVTFREQIKTANAYVNKFRSFIRGQVDETVEPV